MSTDVFKKDFRKFLWLVWNHIGLPDPTPVQYDIANYIQSGPKRSIIQAFRGVGKSYVTSAYSAWIWLNDPNAKVLVVSASKERADAFSTFTQRIISELPITQHLQPSPDQRNSKVAFDVGPAVASHAPSCKSVGITGTITGSRCNYLIADDVEVPNNSATQLMRDKLSELVKEFDSVLSPGGRIIYLGTPQTEDSLYTRLQERGYSTRIWPALKPSANEEVGYGGTLAPYVSDLDIPAGSTVDPDRFSETDLAERQASYGKAGFALQFQLSTSMSDADRYPLKMRDVLFMPLDPETAPMSLTWGPIDDRMIRHLPNVGMKGDGMYEPMAVSNVTSPYTGSVMAIDPSGRGADETGYAVVKMLNGYLFVHECGGLKGGYDEDTLTLLANIAERNKVNAVITESNFGDGMFTELFRPVLHRSHKCLVEEVRHSKQKERRMIDTLEPVMMRHKLVVDPKVIENDYRSANAYESTQRLSKMLVYQMTRLTSERGALRHDDRIDALSIAVAYWSEQMAVDEARGIARQKQEALDNELRKFMKSAGKNAPRPRWVDLSR